MPEREPRCVLLVDRIPTLYLETLRLLTALDRRIYCGGQVTLRAAAGRGRGPVLGRGRVRYRGRARTPVVARLGPAGARAIARHAVAEVELIAYGAAHGRCFQARSDPALYRIRL